MCLLMAAVSASLLALVKSMKMRWHVHVVVRLFVSLYISYVLIKR